MRKNAYFLILAGVACTGVKPIDTQVGDDTGGSSFGNLYMDPSSVDFGEVGIGEEAVADVVLSNNGASALTITDALVGGDATFSLQSTLSLPMDLETGGESILTLGFSPESAVYYYGTLRLAVSGEDGYGEVALTGAGTEDATDSGGGGDSGGGDEGGSTGSLSLSRSSIDFGEVDVWDPVAIDVDVSNTGDDDLLLLDAISSDAEFEVSGDGFSFPATLTAGQTRTISVAYAPEDEGRDNGTIQLTTNTDGVGASIAVNGEGYQSCSICQPIITVDTGGTDDYTMSFFWLISTDGHSKSQPLAISNTGDQDLTVSSIVVNNDVIATCGTFSTDFTGAAFTLAAGESKSIAVTYEVTESCLDLPSTSFDTNILHITSNDPSDTDYTVSLSATVL